MDNHINERLLNSEAEGTSLKERIWVESKKLWRISFPSVLFRVTSFGMLVVSQSFIGEISAVDLAAYALMQTILVRFANGVMLGLSSATETLCGQAFGAKQYHMMGIYLQRSWIINIVVATVMTLVFIFATPIFRLLGQEEEIAAACEKYSLWFLPYIYYLLFSRSIQMYLQAQLKNTVIGWLSASTFVIHVLLSWIFVSKLHLGTNGAMGALTISTWLMVIGMFVYVFGGWCPQTWKGFTMAAFSDLVPVIKLSVSSGVMLCLELWYYCIVLLVAGYLKNATVAISAFSICLNINFWVLMIFLGLFGGASVRVSNELGKGNAEAAKFAVNVVVITGVLIGLVFWILCLIFGRDIAYLFTSDEEVAETVTSLSVLLAFSLLLSSVQPVLSGVAIGAGWQGVVAYVNLACYYIIGVPLGVLLAYAFDLSVRGMWIGLMGGLIMQTLALIYITCRTDWSEQVKKASERINRWSMNSSQESNQSSSQA
ncbi:protein DETOXIFICATION 24 [Vitis vinifera]|nr:protein DETOXIFICATION 24 [Vitis vinifera]XP_010653160.1 protein DETOXIFICATION 24 [Vitis vinifera]|eukprot:XP_002267831.1 PREDICTED: protein DETOXIFICATION 24 [Vitis vinifera]